MVLRDWVYGITVKVSKSKYKIRYYFMACTLIFQIMHINIFALTVKHFLNKKYWKNKKNI